MNWKIGLINSEHVLTNGKVQELIKDQEKTFDLVFADQFNQESLYLFAHKFKCPLVTVGEYFIQTPVDVLIIEYILGPVGYTSAMDLAKGLLTPLSFVPHPVLPYIEEMTFLQRVYNVFLTAYDAVLWRFNYMPAQNKLARKYFREGIQGEIPHVIRMERDISVMLVNTHRSLNIPRPQMPGQIDVAGAHVRPASLLPNDFQVR